MEDKEETTEKLNELLTDYTNRLNIVVDEYYQNRKNKLINVLAYLVKWITCFAFGYFLPIEYKEKWVITDITLFIFIIIIFILFALYTWLIASILKVKTRNKYTIIDEINSIIKILADIISTASQRREHLYNIEKEKLVVYKIDLKLAEAEQAFITAQKFNQ